MSGSIGILNVGAGDTKIVFDKKNPQDCIRAARIVKDMLKRGYALLVEVKKGKYQRVMEFREDTCEYLIADLDPQEGEHGKAVELEAPQAHDAPGAGKGNGRRGRRGGRRAIAATEARAVAVGRTAGG